MIKLSTTQVRALRAIRDNEVYAINARTLTALRNAFAIRQDAGNGSARLATFFSLTPTGRTLLDEYERAERVAKEAAERKARPVPAGAFVEPSARTAPVLGHEYEDETDEDEDEVPPGRCPAQFAMSAHAPHSCDREAGHEGDHRGTNGHAVAAWDDRSPYHTNSPCIVEPVTEPVRPAVRLTPAKPGMESEATDGAILQLLALMDSGARVSRRLYGMFTIENPDGDGPAFYFPLDADAVDRAARDAVRFGLARQVFADRLYHLTAEPVHREGESAVLTYCGRYLRNPARGRIRYTSDPSRVTHEGCKH